MKKWIVLLAMLAVGITFAPQVARGQGAKKGPDVMRDPDMEKESLHNLEVAWQYYKLRKAYVATLQRCEEVLAGNPAFSKLDEVLFLAGKSSVNLAEGKGKQKPDQYVIHEGDKKVTLSPQEFREKARDYLSQLYNDYPQSKYRSEAEEDLKALGGPRPKEAKP